MKIGVIGHRPRKLNNEFDMYGPVSDEITLWVAHMINNYKPEMVYTNVSIGTGMLVALACTELKVPFVAIVPFVGQDRDWPYHTREVYDALLDSANMIYVADKKVYLTYKQFKLVKFERYDQRSKALKRQTGNEWLVDQLGSPYDRLLAIHNGSGGSTKECIQYAQLRSVKILYFDPSKVALTENQET